MSIQRKLLIGIFLIAFFLLVADAIYFFLLPKNFLNFSVLKQLLPSPSPIPLLASTPTDKIVWHDMSDIKFSGMDLNKLNQSSVESQSASSSGMANYQSSSDSANKVIFVGKYKKYTNNAIIITEGEKERLISIPFDSTARLWKKTPNKLFVASPSLDQIIKYDIVGYGLKRDDLVLGLSVKNVNVSNQQGIWIIVFSQN